MSETMTSLRVAAARFNAVFLFIKLSLTTKKKGRVLLFYINLAHLRVQLKGTERSHLIDSLDKKLLDECGKNVFNKTIVTTLMV